MTIDPVSIVNIVGVVVLTVAKWLVYTGLLWGMLRIQKLNYNVLGLFGSSLAATLVAFIPYGGSYLSYVVLVLCLWKCTGAEIAPDILFTVGIAGALMFCVNLFVIGSLMGQLRPDLAANARDGFGPPETTETEFEATAELDEGDETATNSAQATPGAPTNGAAQGPESLHAAAGPLVLKGLTLNSKRPSAMISDGSHVYTVFPGESFTATVGSAEARYRCDEISRTGVALSAADGQRLVLRMQ